MVGKRADEMADELHRRGSGPLQIVEHDDEGSAGSLSEQRRDGGEHGGAVTRALWLPVQQGA